MSICSDTMRFKWSLPLQKNQVPGIAGARGAVIDSPGKGVWRVNIGQKESAAKNSGVIDEIKLKRTTRVKLMRNLQWSTSQSQVYKAHAFLLCLERLIEVY
ncbi:hypothetical protein MPSEU_000519300 [Mayamaea pseudoterrestris]|nr:hypothetical protein MPSEU_000519300 [Mayamaea pseudoterrestris]